MKKKLKIAFIINFSHERWLGGSNYYLNIFKAIRLHTNHSIKIFTGINKTKLNPGFIDYEVIYLKSLNPKLKMNIFTNYIRIFTLMFFKRDFILEKILKKYNIDVLSHSFPLGLNSNIKSLYWIPDLQELFLKDNFSLKKRLKRWIDNYIAISNSSGILFSSKTMRNIFNKLYQKSKKKSHVLKFINYLPENKPKGNLTKNLKNFFLISNQFWIHKNYEVVLNALIELKKKKLSPLIISTGTKHEYRSSTYYSSLLSKIKNNRLINFKILGKISRNEQLNLILNAKYLINPSKFEGWNTAIEEAKSLKTPVIASNLNVHREQLGKNADYFDPNKFKYLSNIIKDKMNIKEKKTKKNYKKLLKTNRKKFKLFAHQYNKILNNL